MASIGSQSRPSINTNPQRATLLAQKRLRSSLPLLGFVVVLLLLRFYAVHKVKQAYDPKPPPKAIARPAPRAIANRRLGLTKKHTCFVVRTYYGHGHNGTNGLARMLRLFKSMHMPSWEVLLVVQDSHPFPDLTSIVKSIRDARIRIFRNQVGPEYAAKLPDGNWRPEYHTMLYQTTDDAIAACKPNTQWVVVTNGDNEYDPRFGKVILDAPTTAGVIAFPYYSRYQRPTAKPCERFAAVPGAPPCKDNLLRFCQTDLAANVFNWPLMRAQNRTFSAMPSFGLGLNDGYLAAALVEAKWQIHAIKDRCLVAHSPNPQLCSIEGGVWDDSSYAGYADSGGRCITREQAAELLAKATDLEAITITLSADHKAFRDRHGAIPGSRRYTNFTCIRHPMPAGEWHNTFFPPECAAPFDMPPPSPPPANTTAVS